MLSCDMRALLFGVALLLVPQRQLCAESNEPSTNGQRTIVILQSFAQDSGPFNAVGAALQESLREPARKGGRLVFVTMDMDVARHGLGPFDAHTSAEAIRRRLVGTNVHVVVAIGDPAARIIAGVRDEVFPGTPAVMVACNAGSSAKMAQGSNTVVLAQDLSAAPAAGNILRLLPDTTNIVVIAGTTAPERAMLVHFARDFNGFTNRVSFPVLWKLSMEEIKDYCAKAPQRSAILFLSLARDGAGVEYDYDFGLRNLLAVANAPVFALFESQFGDRVVGGPHMPDTSLGRQAAEVVRRILGGEKPEDIAVPVSTPSAPVYDARELERWQIDEALLPPGSAVRFRPPSLWDRYRLQILILLSGLLAQSAFIVALLANHHRLRQSRRKLAESEEQRQLAEQAARLGFWAWDVATDRVWASRYLRELFGFGAEEALTIDSLTSRVHPDDRPNRRRALDEALRNGEADYEIEFRIVRPDGSLRWIGSRGKVSRHGRDARVSGVSIDITARKTAESVANELRNELVHVARVSTVGELAASLAHELNQPLAAIIANTDAAEIHARGPSPDLAEIQTILDDIRRDGMRAGDTIHRMRGFLQRREMDAQAVDIDQLVRDCVRFVDMDAATRKVAIECQIEPDLPRGLGDRIQLQQVLLNLMVNGMDAMKDAPERARRLSVRARQASNTLIEFSVSDAGHGIPPEKLAEVFAPFFTTKRNGLGLGLAISRTIVEAHGGRLQLENNPTGGATARFTLPIAAGAQAK